MTFTGRDKLILGRPSSFDGTIDDFFTKGDTVALRGFAESATSLLRAAELLLADADRRREQGGAFAGEPYTHGDFSLVAWFGGAGAAIRFV